MKPKDNSLSFVRDDASLESSVIRDLTDAQKQRLTDLLDQYMVGLEQDKPLDPETLCAAHPDLADALRSYLSHLEALHEIAAGFAGAAHDSLPVDPGSVAWESESDAARRLGDFRLGREIGRGGMGVVYEAQQISLDRRVALKVLPFAAVLDAKQIARFKNEAQAAAQVHHPNIVPVFAVGVERGVHYYAMQLIDGQPLDRAIRQLAANHDDDRSKADVRAELELAALNATRGDAGATTVASQPYLIRKAVSRRTYMSTVAQLGIQAAEALHAAHEYGVVHRDIKPSNLLVDDQGKLWVTDFGLARCHTDGSLTRSGDMLGTLRYMSPEQTRGHNSYIDHRTDVYSLGVTLYELLTLKPAFPGDNQVTLIRMIETQEPVRPRQHCPELPADLETIVLKAMSKSRDERYESALALADDLRRYLAGMPPIAQPPSWLDRVSKWARRHRRSVASAIAVGLVLLVVLSITTVTVVALQRAADQSRRRAEDNFRAAMQAVEHFGMWLPEELAEIPGAEGVHQEFLSEALDYYKRFAAQTADDDALREMIALSHSKIGTLQERGGDRTAALQSHRKALELFTALQQTEPLNIEHQRHLGLCQNNLGQIYSETGDLTAARAAFDAALAWQEALVAADADPVYRSDLALTQNNLALLDFKMGQSQQAILLLEQAIRTQRELIRQRSERRDDVAQLGTFYLNLSGMLAETQPELARQWSEEALFEFQRLNELEPASPAHLRRIASVLNQLGMLQSRAGQYKDAVESHRKAQQILQQLHTAAPLETDYRADLALTWNSLGSILNQLRDFPAAAACFEQAVQLQAGLAEQLADDVEVRSTLGGMYNNLGVARKEAAQFDLAAEAFVNAIDAQQTAWRARPENPRYRDFLNNHQYNQGDVLRQLGQGVRAAELALQRGELWPEDPRRLQSIASELAMDVAVMRRQGVDAATCQRWEETIRETLRKAGRHGLKISDVNDLPEPLRGLKSIRELRELWK